MATLGVLAGALWLVIGIIVLVWPSATLTVIAVLFGLQLTIVGIVRLVSGLFGSDLEGWVRAAYVLLGVLMLLAGIACLRHPVLSIGAILLLTAVGWMVEGIALVIGGTRAREGRGWLFFFGAAAILGSIVLLVWPVESVSTLLVLGGWILVIVGIIALVAGIMALRDVSRATKARAAVA
ncbi:hypothetical protein N865_10395 [Intrasporangium oryzae NRRL B-24470]|uniref:HdeD family acid-resistance protein n=2 Tax=Intrasporangium TaxID=53357 RepID=W9G600_9MICO|nr:hypothetical protein N865_10395 [Intrasporangium oryzae NRRL B-24470]